jgi:hypothetical protein
VWLTELDASASSFIGIVAISHLKEARMSPDRLDEVIPVHG